MSARFTSFTRSTLGRFLPPSFTLPIAIVMAGALFIYWKSSSAVPASSSAMELSPDRIEKPRRVAPDFPGGADWLNTDKPINLNDLKGRIVILDFWTLCCINCIHTLPDLAKLEAQYPGMVVVIGVHSPKFENEKLTASILKAILRYEIKHPVVNDADHKMWRKYGVDSWPTQFLIDPDGKIVGFTTGEGSYEDLEFHVSRLVKEYKAKGKLKETPLEFKVAREKATSPLYFPGKVLAHPASNRLFIADSTNHRIVITSLDGKKISIAGNSVQGLKDGKFAEAQFSDPQGMALDGEILYVADRKNHNIRALDLKALTVKTVAGIGEQDRYSRMRGGPALKIGLNSPWDLLLHDKKLYIAMAGHHQIWTYDIENARVAPYAGNGRENIGDGPLRQSSFAQPSGLASDGKTLYVADSEISAVRSLPLDGKGEVTTIVGEGLFEFGDKNGKGDEVRLQHAMGIAYLDGKLYIADTYNNKIKIIDPEERTCDTYLGDSKNKIFNEPGGICIAGGKLYVADTNNHRIQIVDMKTKAITTLRLQNVEPVRRETVVKKESK